MSRIRAVTVDFYDTLVFHRDGRGRGALLVEYLEAQGLEHAPWEHAVLYDVFEGHEIDYAPHAADEVRAAYHLRLARRVFERLRIPASDDEVSRHAGPLWEILGPSCLDLFPDAVRTLEALRADGYPVALISNWQSGVRHYCDELGLGRWLDHVVGSGDLGVAKPDARIFAEACARLDVPPSDVLHVGDSLTDDYLGAEAAGLVPVLLAREREAAAGAARAVRRMDEIPELLRGGV